MPTRLSFLFLRLMAMGDDADGDHNKSQQIPPSPLATASINPFVPHKCNKDLIVSGKKTQSYRKHVILKKSNLVDHRLHGDWR
jgi:hypothetical protein